MKMLLIAGALLAAAPSAAAQLEDAAVNQVYADLVRARAAHDTAGMVAAFAPEGLLVDARPGPAITGAELAARLQPMAARLAAEKIDMRTDYRVERRSISGDLALDAGYMRQTMTRPDGQRGVRYARFLVTMRRGPNGWRIIGDASMPADEAAWTALRPVTGLRFDG